MHYLKGWFACDLFGALPFDYFVYAATGQYLMGVQVRMYRQPISLSASHMSCRRCNHVSGDALDSVRETPAAVSAFAHFQSVSLSREVRVVKRVWGVYCYSHFFGGRYEEHISANTIKVVKLVFALIFWIHIDSCMYFLVARCDSALPALRE